MPKGHENSELFESLRALRKDLAKKAHLPPYMIFSDRTLNDMCAILPRNDSEMLMVHGVGQSKLEKYGKEFLEAIHNFQ